GSINIMKAISIQAHGFAGITVGAGGTAITINAQPNDAVNLTGLIIEGEGVGATGILFNTGKSLTIENSIVRNVTGIGIHFLATGSSALAVSNTLVADTGNIGIFVAPTGSGTITAAFSRVEAHNNPVSAGIYINGTSASGGSITAAVTDCVAVGNGFGYAV